MRFVHALAAVYAALVSACASDHKSLSIALHYRLMPNSTPIEAAKQVAIAVDIYDGRPEHRDRVSARKDRRGVEIAPITATRDVPLVFKDILEAELKERGFHFGPGGGTAHLDLFTFYNDFKFGLLSGSAAANVDFRAQVWDAARNVIYSKDITSTGTAAGGFSAGAEEAKSALENGLQTAVADLMNDPDFIGALIKSGTPPEQNAAGAK